ncbi:uncharacterized protein LOC144763336 [Lissotriton helveticus]
MNEALESHKEYCSVYLDDIVVFSKTWEQHLDHIHKILKALQAAGLHVNAKKSRAAFPKVKYLGFMLGEGVIAPQEEKGDWSSWPLLDETDKNEEGAFNWVYTEDEDTPTRDVSFTRLEKSPEEKEAACDDTSEEGVGVRWSLRRDESGERSLTGNKEGEPGGQRPHEAPCHTPEGGVWLKQIRHKCWKAPTSLPTKPDCTSDSSACNLHKKPRSWNSFLNLFRTQNKNVHVRISRSTEAMYTRTPGQLQKKQRRRFCSRNVHQRVRCIDTADEGSASDSTSWGNSETEPDYCKRAAGPKRPCAQKVNKRSKPKLSRDDKARSTRDWLAQNCGHDGRSSTEECVRKSSCHDKAPPRGQARGH